MALKIGDFFYINGNKNLKIQYDNDINCPYCSIKNVDRTINSYVTNIVNKLDETNEPYHVYMLFLCRECNQVYMAKYQILENFYKLTHKYEYNAQLISISPHKQTNRNFENTIKLKFPDFIKYYNEALNIEYMGYNESAGMIYRKSLEFLIKDYLIEFENKTPEDFKDKGKSMGLNLIIDKYLQNDKLKYPSKLANFIGNDFSHYELKLEKFDLNDMKKYIDTIIYFIQFNISADESKDIVQNLKN